MAITNSQQFKQLLAQGGRTGLLYGGNPNEERSHSLAGTHKGEPPARGSEADRMLTHKNVVEKPTVGMRAGDIFKGIRDYVKKGGVFGTALSKLNSLGTGWRSHMMGMPPGEAQARGLDASHHGSTTSGNLHAGNVNDQRERGRGGDYPISILPKTPYQQDIIEEEDSSGGILNSDRVAYRLLADGGRVPAAFGGIMDSATGRRAYGFGSIFKKATKLPRKVAKTLKKVAKSDLGKLALMYAAGTYLGGTTMFGGTGTLSPWKRFANPKLLANLGNPFRTGIGSGSQVGWKFPGFGGTKILPGSSSTVTSTKGFPITPGNVSWPGDYGTTAKLGSSEQLARAVAKDAGKGSLWKTAATIGIPSVIAGAMTAEQPIEDWDEDKTAYGEDIDIAAIRANPRKYLAPRFAAEGGLMRTRYAGGMDEKLIEIKKIYDDYVKGGGTLSFEQFAAAFAEENFAEGGRVAAQEGGLMDLGGMEKDYREEGGFVPIGGEEKADDVPARLSKNEFVFTADAVRAAGGGDIDAGAEVMYNVMKNLEAGGDVSEESQGLEGAREMFQTSQRLEEVI